jgi:antitoxin PrlF
MGRPVMEATLTSKGQATVPKAVREHLGIRPGGKIRYFIHPDGTVLILPVRPVSALRGMLRSDKHVTIGQMDDAIRRKAAARDRRSRSR